MLHIDYATVLSSAKNNTSWFVQYFESIFFAWAVLIIVPIHISDMSYVWKKKRLFVYFHERVKRLHVDILEKKYFNYKTQLPGQGREKKKSKTEISTIGTTQAKLKRTPSGKKKLLRMNLKKKIILS